MPSPRGDCRVCGVEVDAARAARGEHHDARFESFYDAVFRVVDVQPDYFVLLVGEERVCFRLCDEVYREVVLENLDVFVFGDAFEQSLFDCASRVVFNVQDTPLRVSALATERRRAVLKACELHAFLNQILDLLGAGFHDFAHGVFVAETVACNQRVFDVRFEIVGAACDACDSPLRVVCIGVRAFLFGDDGDLVP